MQTVDPRERSKFVVAPETPSFPMDDQENERRKFWLESARMMGYAVRAVVHFPPRPSTNARFLDPEDQTQIIEAQELHPFDQNTGVEEYAHASEVLQTLFELHGRQSVVPAIAPVELAAAHGFKPDVRVMALLIPASEMPPYLSHSVEA
jgi:hypothetical protein